MAIITYNDKHYELNAQESILDGLLRHNVLINHSCKNGVCQSCLLRTEDTSIPEDAQLGLKATLKQQGYFLACQCLPEEDMQVQSVNASDLYFNAIVVAKKNLSEDVCQLILQTTPDFSYHAGQFVNLHRSDNQIRSYSLTSLAQDDYLELHIKRMDNGVFSHWIHNDLKVGDSIDLQGPFGDCFYLQEDIQQPLLLIGTGTGIAPLWGVAKEALDLGHKGAIKLYFGSRYKKGLYLDSVLRQMANEYKNFEYYACLSAKDDKLIESQSYLQGRASDLALQQITDLKNWNIYLSGLPAMVNTTRKLAYLSGANMKKIYIDPFEMNNLRGAER